jgi:integrase
MLRSRRAEGSVTQKKRRWYAVLNIGRDANGKRIRQWSRGFKTRREAEHALAQLLLDDRVAAETHNTVEYVVSQYIEHDVTSRGRRSPTTTNRYRGLAKNMLPLFKERVDRLDGSTIEALYTSLFESGLSSTTVHHIHNLMSAAFRWAKTKKVGLITRNPLECDDVQTPRRAKSSARSLTVEQAHNTIEALVRTKHRYALEFCLATGCRRGETCGLRWASVDWRRKVAIIRESRYQITGDVGEKTTKPDRVREVPLNATALEALRSEQIRQVRRQEEASGAWIESGHVFCDEIGRPLSPMALTNAFGRIARKAKLPFTAMHNLRHTAATFILSAGGNPAAAAQILGHSEKSTTLRIYGHVIGLDEIRAARSIDRALGSKRILRR